jgi:ABC-type branched-subunit amino acid transport system substrate-binding protein
LFPAVSSSTLGGVGPGPIHDAQTVYFDAFRAAGVRPDFQSAMVWDPAMIVLSAYRALGPDAKADAIQDYLQHLHSWVGINGVYDFRDGSQRGIGVGVGVIAQWDPAKKDFVAVSKLGGYPK